MKLMTYQVGSFLWASLFTASGVGRPRCSSRATLNCAARMLRRTWSANSLRASGSIRSLPSGVLSVSNGDGSGGGVRCANLITAGGVSRPRASSKATRSWADRIPLRMRRMACSLEAWPSSSVAGIGSPLSAHCVHDCRVSRSRQGFNHGLQSPAPAHVPTGSGQCVRPSARGHAGAQSPPEDRVFTGPTRLSGQKWATFGPEMVPGSGIRVVPAIFGPLVAQKWAPFGPSNSSKILRSHRDRIWARYGPKMGRIWLSKCIWTLRSPGALGRSRKRRVPRAIFGHSVATFGQFLTKNGPVLAPAHGRQARAGGGTGTAIAGPPRRQSWRVGEPCRPDTGPPRPERLRAA